MTPGTFYLQSWLSDLCVCRRDRLLRGGWASRQQLGREAQTALESSSGVNSKGIPGESQSCRGSAAATGKHK